MRNAAIASAIERYLAEQLGLHVAVRVSDGLVTLVGRVPSAEACAAVTDVVAGLTPVYRVDNQLELEVLLPETDGPLQVHDVGGWSRDAGHQLADDEPVPADGPAQGQSLEHGDPDTGETAEPYVPPMDPVIGTGARGRIEVRGGFGLSSMDVLDVEPSAQDPLPGDEALADAIRRELREDAATVALVIAVDVCDGVASLRRSDQGSQDAVHDWRQISTSARQATSPTAAPRSIART
jgi:osmotically-inducible protein OsmY